MGGILHLENFIGLPPVGFIIILRNRARQRHPMPLRVSLVIMAKIKMKKMEASLRCKEINGLLRDPIFKS
jgi:hypothetical protein